MAAAAHLQLDPRPQRSGAFRTHHPADAVFFPTMVAVIWLLMLAGFVPEVVERMRSDTAPPYPLIVHVHAVTYFGWLSLLAAQVTLVRTGRLHWHRLAGGAGLALAVLVVIVGPAAGLTMQRLHEARQPPPFLAIQFVSVIAFAGLIVAGFVVRRQPAAHKRLMLIATLALIGAGFGRVIRMVTGAPPPWTAIPAVFFAADALLLVMALYDWRTRGRLHPVFLPAAGGFAALQLVAGQLLHAPAWIGFTKALVS